MIEKNPKNISGKKFALECVRKLEKSPLSLFVRKAKLSTLIVIFILVAGIFQIRNLPRELNPEVEIPIGLVLTSYPGASTIDVEEQVTKKIESKISDLEDIKQVTSASSFGISSINVEFEAGANVTESIRNLKDKVDEVKPDLPDNANNPNVIKLNVNDVPILAFSLGGPYDKAQLKQFAENIKDKLISVPGISSINVVGGQDRQIRIDVLPDKLSEFQLTNNNITNTLAAYNQNFPLGSIDTGTLKYGIRVENEFQTAEEVGNLIIGVNNGVQVRLKDVAQVYDGFSEQQTISRISINGAPPENTITVQVFKRTGGNIVQISSEIKQEVQNIKGQLYPSDVSVVTTTDTAKFITKSINDLSQNGLGTIIIILMLLLIFLGWREALIASLSVPFSFFIAFVIMAMTDQSLNFITLFALVLALGILVDSAVVIVEGMYEKIKKHKMTGYQAALCSINEYAVPLLSGLLTTVAAFTPLLFVKGIIGEFMKGIPIVVDATLIAALFVSLTIIPMIGSKFLKIRKFKKKELNPIPKTLDTLADKYRKTIRSLIASRKKRIWLLTGSWILFFISLYLPFSGFLKTQAFGVSNGDQVIVNLKMPDGTILERTDEVVKAIEKKLENLPETDNFVSVTGTSMSFDIGGGDSGSNLATISINLVDSKIRKLTSSEIAAVIKDRLSSITDGQIQIIEASAGPPSAAPLVVTVKGQNLNELDTVSKDFEKIMASIPGTEEINTNLNFLPGEFIVKFNPNILAQYNLTPIGLASEIRKGVSGDDNLKINKKGEEVAINLKYSKNLIGNINDLRNLGISTPTDQIVGLGEIADITLKSGISSIRHQDEERAVTISGKNARGYTVNDIINQFKERVKSYDLPQGYSITYGGESQQQQEVYVDMFQKMIIGILLILFILVAQFNSYKQVLIILFTIPLAMIGVLWGLTLAGLILDIPAFIGIVSLTGIVVNNAIILIDSINRYRKERGLELIEAVVTASHSRLRPIILTTATTVLGLLPLSIREADWRNMGFSIIFGLTFSTILTLFVVPSFYVSLESLKKKNK